MDAPQRAEIVHRLADAFGGAEDVTPSEGEPLHVLLTALELPDPWTPSPTTAVTIWANWPQERPGFVISTAVIGENGDPPRSHHEVYLLGATWRGFSFSFAWSGHDPVRAVQMWLSRFVVETS